MHSALIVRISTHFKGYLWTDSTAHTAPCIMEKRIQFKLTEDIVDSAYLEEVGVRLDDRKIQFTIMRVQG
jgi:hypothetical protein